MLIWQQVNQQLHIQVVWLRGSWFLAWESTFIQRKKQQVRKISFWGWSFPLPFQKVRALKAGELEVLIWSGREVQVNKEIHAAPPPIAVVICCQHNESAILMGRWWDRHRLDPSALRRRGSGRFGTQILDRPLGGCRSCRVCHWHRPKPAAGRSKPQSATQIPKRGSGKMNRIAPKAWKRPLDLSCPFLRAAHRAQTKGAKQETGGLPLWEPRKRMN